MQIQRTKLQKPQLSLKHSISQPSVSQSDVSQQPQEPRDGFDARSAIDFTSKWSKRAGLVFGATLAATSAYALAGGSSGLNSLTATVLQASAVGVIGLGASSLALSLASNEQGRITGLGDAAGQAWQKASAPGAGHRALESVFSAGSSIEAAQKVGMASAIGLVAAEAMLDSPVGLVLGLTTMSVNLIGTGAFLGAHLFDPKQSGRRANRM